MTLQDELRGTIDLTENRAVRQQLLKAADRIDLLWAENEKLTTEVDRRSEQQTVVLAYTPEMAEVVGQLDAMSKDMIQPLSFVQDWRVKPLREAASIIRSVGQLAEVNHDTTVQIKVVDNAPNASEQT